MFSKIRGLGDCVRILLVKALILFRVRVNGTKFPLIWLFLPTILRVTPFAFIVFSLADAETGLRFVQVTLITAPSSILIRRIFRITSLNQRLPDWLTSKYGIANTLLAFSFLTVIETLPALLIISLSISVVTNLEWMVGVRFFGLTTLLMVFANLILIILAPALLIAYEKFEDVRFAARYSFTLLNAYLMAAIKFNFHNNIFLNLLPGVFFSNMTLLPYGGLSFTAFVSSIAILIFTIIVFAIKYPLHLLQNLGNSDLDSEGY